MRIGPVSRVWRFTREVVPFHVSPAVTGERVLRPLPFRVAEDNPDDRSNFSPGRAVCLHLDPLHNLDGTVPPGAWPLWMRGLSWSLAPRSSTRGTGVRVRSPFAGDVPTAICTELLTSPDRGARLSPPTECRQSWNEETAQEGYNQCQPDRVVLNHLGSILNRTAA